MDNHICFMHYTTGDVQSCVNYHQDDMSELVTNGKRRAYFWRSQLPGTRLISYYSPPLKASDFHQEVGDFMTSVFVPGSTQVRSSTVQHKSVNCVLNTTSNPADFSTNRACCWSQQRMKCGDVFIAFQSLLCDGKIRIR